MMYWQTFHTSTSSSLPTQIHTEEEAFTTLTRSLRRITHSSSRSSSTSSATASPVWPTNTSTTTSTPRCTIPIRSPGSPTSPPWLTSPRNGRTCCPQGPSCRTAASSPMCLTGSAAASSPASKTSRRVLNLPVAPAPDAARSRA